jgi:hypothetical protein
VWDGDVTVEDASSYADAVLVDPNWPAGKRQLEDATTLRSLVTSGFVDQIGRDERARGLQVAIVGGQRWDQFRNAEREFEPYGVTVIVFNQLRGACDWLRLDPATADAAIAALREQLRAAHADPETRT